MFLPKFNKIIMLLLLTHSLVSTAATNKHVIGARWGCGFFSNFFQIINHLKWCEKVNKTPVVHWDKNCLYWQKKGFNGSFNVWEYYFEPVSSEKYKNGDKVDRNYQAPDGFYMTWGERFLRQDERNLANQLIKKYIKIKPYVTNGVNKFYQKNLSNCVTIGIHMRGTDKKFEVKVVDPITILETARVQAEKIHDYNVKFFVASDEQRLIDLATNYLHSYEVIVYPALRSNNGQPIHTHLDNLNKAKSGLDILTEVLLLSQCSIFIHTISNVSNAVIAFNKDLTHVPLKRSGDVNVFAQPSYINLLEIELE